MVEVHSHGETFVIETENSCYFVALHEQRPHHVAFVPNSRRHEVDVDEALRRPFAPEAEVHAGGEPRMMQHGPRWLGCSVTARATYQRHRVDQTPSGHRLVLETLDADTELAVDHSYEVFKGSSCLTRTVTVRNTGSQPRLIEHLGSASLHHLPHSGESGFDETWLHTIDGGWCWEGPVRSRRLVDEGLFPGLSMAAATIDTVGSWSSKKILPFYVLEDRATGLSWAVQVEHSASWRVEVGVQEGRFYTQAGLANWEAGHWRVALAPGASYESVPVTLGVAEGGIDAVSNVFHRHRRMHQVRPSERDADMPVVFNEFMASFGQPTLESITPQIDALKGTGVDVFVIDGGWYSPPDEPYGWWSHAGTWKADPVRFPGGLNVAVERISAAGMQPGIWVEIESLGSTNPIRDDHPDWLMHRDGRAVDANGRCFLDFGHPGAYAHAKNVLIGLYADGFRYIKLDYNVDCSIGTDRGASPGEGLVTHIRSFYALLDEVRAACPDLVVENCASGGNRLDYGLLSHTDLCSFTDHGTQPGDWDTYPGIVADGIPLAVHPRQMGSWALLDGTLDDQAICFRLAGAVVTRMHVTGAVQTLHAQGLERLREATAFHKRWRHVIDDAQVFRHLQAPLLHRTDDWLALEIEGRGDALLAVWRRASIDEQVTLSLRGLDPEQEYEISTFPAGHTRRACGSELMQTFPVELPSRFSATVYAFEAVSSVAPA